VYKSGGRTGNHSNENMARRELANECAATSHGAQVDVVKQST
jgi:hypothetical protein